MLTLRLKRVPNVLGIYGTKPIGEVPAGDYFPPSMSLLHPDAADAYQALEKGTGKRLRVSDMFRTAESSLMAMQQKSGVLPPGFSGHNFGFSIDVAVDAAQKAFGFRRKAELDTELMAYGWFCHRKDGQRGMEDWHYNFFGTGPEKDRYLQACSKSTTTAAGLEARLQDVYGANFTYATAELQAQLAKLKMYGGTVDGDFGPRTQAAVLAFERAWKLPEDGGADPRMMRTLALVAAEQLIVS